MWNVVDAKHAYRKKIASPTHKKHFNLMTFEWLRVPSTWFFLLINADQTDVADDVKFS